MIIPKRSIEAIFITPYCPYTAILITGSKCSPCHALLDKITASPEEDQSALLKIMAVIEYDDPSYPENKTFAMSAGIRTVPALVLSNMRSLSLYDEEIKDAKALMEVIAKGSVL